MIFRKYIEFDVVSHCNLKCTGCSHNSENNAPYYASLEVFERDLEILSKVMHVEEFRLLGGEPLIHKDLDKFVNIIRKLNFADKVTICTNGALISEKKIEVLKLFDRIDITAYLNTGIDYREKVKYLQENIPHSEYKLRIEYKTHFTEMFTQKPTDKDKNYSECKIVNEWECHTFKDGRYFKCYSPIAIKEKYGLDFIEDDSVSLFSDNLEENLNSFIKSKTALKSCENCLGTSGKRYIQLQNI